jgi:hypothetical protein
MKRCTRVAARNSTTIAAVDISIRFIVVHGPFQFDLIEFSPFDAKFVPDGGEQE